ncbi:DUF922 domain-containing protein [Oricola thermophila]|uniref:DUF922 domain-containing protein n=1 Tax=Oricola thermophila TaxID=2742145 RepID=A0A6N1V835_9HYPH|nr:DUF922 domain-containing protein [Oricola thermophila]QKV17126.1 DUF922 domain-containing protein [Oricola thermophila]
MRALPSLPAIALLLLAAPAAAAEIRARVVVKTYPVSGETGAALYAAIGGGGPLVGGRRAIARTDFDLRWGRDYVRDGRDCVLAAARPFLTVTYTLPEPSGPLPPETAARWARFAAAIRSHEEVHGRYVEEMAREIYDATVGFRQENDPGCTAIREAIQAPLKAAYARYRERNAAFEASEMAPGGPIRRRVLELVR